MRITFGRHTYGIKAIGFQYKYCLWKDLHNCIAIKLYSRYLKVYWNWPLSSVRPSKDVQTV